MQLGLMIFPTDVGIQPVELAREAEARGFHSLWFTEHSHIPVSRRTPWGGRPGADPLPEQYWRTHDQFVALAAAAAVTSSIRLGTGITLVAQRDPLWLAKEVASLDVISGGRFTLGVGYGWNLEEMESHGVDTAHRRALVREKILTCKALWTQEQAEFHGTYVDLVPSWAWPKPVQFPNPPIVLGGPLTPSAIRNIVEWADGWMPIDGVDDLAGRWATLQQAAGDAGRDPTALQLGVFGAAADRRHLDELRTAGVQFASLGLHPMDRDAAIRAMDRYAPLLAEFDD